MEGFHLEAGEGRMTRKFAGMLETVPAQIEVVAKEMSNGINSQSLMAAVLTNGCS